MKKTLIALSLMTLISCTGETDSVENSEIKPADIPTKSEMNTATKAKKTPEKQECLDKAKSSKFSFADTLLCSDRGI